MQTFEVVSDTKDERFKLFMGFARFIVSKDDDPEVLKAKKNMKLADDGMTGQMNDAISKENELATWWYIGTIIDTHLDQYPTTLIEDQKLIE